MKLPHIRIAIAVLCAVLTAVIWSTVSVHRTLHRLLSRTDSVQAAAQNAAEEIDLLISDRQACSPRLMKPANGSLLRTGHFPPPSG